VSRGRRIVFVIVAVGLVSAVGLIVAGRRTSAAATNTATDPASASTTAKTAPVQRTDLVDRATVTGELGYGEAVELGASGDGTITWLPAEGAVVDRGQAIARVDERPLPLLFGSIPLYRDLSAASTDGADIRELEENLVALGDGDGVTVDDHFDAATQAAVQRWQKALGVEQNGMVSRGAYVVSAGPVRVQDHKAKVGDRLNPGTALVAVTGTARLVTVDLDPAKQSYVQVGDEAEIQLPDHRTVRGHIASVGTVATASGDDSKDGQGDDTSSTIAVTVTLDDPSQAGTLDQAPVSVKVERSRAEGVLAVPVKALLVLKEGGYAVEVVADGSSTPTLTPVETGNFADGMVEISGAIDAGQRVVVAS